MTVRTEPWPAGTPCWVDISVPDLPAATAFYSAVLGWEFTNAGEEYGNYHMARTGGHAAAGMGPIMQEGQPTVWTVHVASDDADATAKLVTEHGGNLMFDPMDVPGNGRMCVALDPDGGAFGIWQADGMIGAEIVNEPGSLTWTDARLTDVDAGKAFYSAVFGYTYEPVPGAPGDYGTIQLNGRTVGGMGGMMGAPQGTPAHWVPYFSVADVDAAVAAAGQGGGRVLMPAEDTPFGRMGIVTDPFGASFAVHQAPEAQ